MARPFQEVKIYAVQDRRSTRQAKLPWIVRHKLDGKQRSKSFRTKSEADRYRTLLHHAVQQGERFDQATGEPESWQAPLADMKVYEWARRWAADQWGEWQPRTRRSAAEALARLAVSAQSAHPNPPAGLRRYLQETFSARADQKPDNELEQWLAKNSLALGDLDREQISRIDRELGLKLDGSPLAATTTNRIRIVARACVLAAVEVGAVEADVWPPRSRARARRKVARTRQSVDVRALPGPTAMADAIDAIATHQPGSRTYRVMTAVAYYAGLRPSEVVMLRVRSLILPEDGWGRIDVTEADISFDEPGEPKTGPRSVPIPPVLVRMLSDWISEAGLRSKDELLFRTRNGTMPGASNWRRAWHRGLKTTGQNPLRIYDCRHAAATTWLRAGMPLAETARRLGHSVETLVSTYVGALDDEERVANQRVESMLS
ncbi:MAG: tyrosine-type recombinase/integrase [Acidimicrobiales bacterium]